jgi:carboxymethylenebutenolidase
MGEKVAFLADDKPAEGYMAQPAQGRGPAVVVIQEWWGLVPHIEDIVERFAREGFLALAPDLYHGKKTTSPDAAGRLLMELDVERAAAEIAGAGRYLLSNPGSTSKRYGVVGFCMGGALAQYAATSDPNVGALVSFYGGFKKVPVKWENLSCPALLIYGEKDQSVPAAEAAPLAEKLTALGKNAETVVYPGAGHAFFNDARPEAHHPEAAREAWTRTLAFFREHLGPGAPGDGINPEMGSGADDKV